MSADALTACRSGQCLRKVRPGVVYCCTPCAEAWEGTPRHDVDGLHSAGCDQRAGERGEFTPAEAEEARMVRRLLEGWSS